MKRIIIIFTVLLIISGFVWAQDTVIRMDPFVPRSPEVMAQGGSFTAVASGYNSLFTNPAGFASDKISLTLVTANPWVYIRPDEDFVDTIMGVVEGGDSVDPMMTLVPAINDQVTTGGVGVGFSSGLGWTGKGLGLGVVAMVDSYIYGNTLLGAEGEATATVGLIGGFALPLEIFDDLKLTIGGDVRPMYRAYVPMDNSVVINLLSSLEDDTVDPMSILLSQPAFAGIGLGIDVGAMLDIGPFTIGLSVRDLFGTPFSFGAMTLDDIQQDVVEGIIPPEPDVELTSDLIGDNTVYRIPMEISVGGAFHPDLGGFSFVLDPKVHIDLKDPIGVIRDGMSPWSLLHIGGEVKLLKTLALRAGFHQGYITGGVGLDLLIAEINASFFTIERGQYSGDRPNTGVTVEAALRF